MLKDTNSKPQPAQSSMSVEDELARVETDLYQDLTPYVLRLEALHARLAHVPGVQRAEMGARINLAIGRVKGALGRF
jgi:hypothetical protein